MKRILLIGLLATALLACDKVDNIYPKVVSTELNYDLYPGGDSADYANNEWPTFTQNTNTQRNLLVEDYTGHRCVFCPPAAELAKQLESNNPGTVFSAAVHTGPEPFNETNWNATHIAPGDFQTVVPPTYIHNFANAEALQIGDRMGPNGVDPSSQFFGNPQGTVSRIKDGSNQITISPANWSSAVASALAANDLKVNIQAASNYYPSTSGLFLHTEIEIIDPTLTNDLYTVVYLLEDSIIKPQKFPSSVDSLNYLHHNVMRGCIDGRFLGQKLDAAHMQNGKYYFNYSYALPAGPEYTSDGHLYDDTNLHLLIYVRDAVTEEIYQVIKHDFN